MEPKDWNVVSTASPEGVLLRERCEKDDGLGTGAFRGCRAAGTFCFIQLRLALKPSESCCQLEHAGRLPELKGDVSGLALNSAVLEAAVGALGEALGDAQGGRSGDSWVRQ